TASSQNFDPGPVAGILTLRNSGKMVSASKSGSHACSGNFTVVFRLDSAAAASGWSDRMANTGTPPPPEDASVHPAPSASNHPAPNHPAPNHPAPMTSLLR